jgi:hypothetical protein
MTYYYCDKPGTNCGAVVVAKGGSTSKLPAGARQKDRHSVMRLGRKIVPIKTDDLEKRELFEEIGRANLCSDQSRRPSDPAAQPYA